MSLQIIGDPVLHSKSPVIQGAMLARLGLDIDYTPHVVRRGELPQYLAWAKENGVTGFNATMPHKEDLLPLLDWLDGDAALCGAANTVCLREGRWVGFNTDGDGFIAALDHELHVSSAGKIVVLLGAGGVARASAYALARAGAERVYVCNRTPERAQALCRQYQCGALVPMDLAPDTLSRLCREADLLVNCTSLGMEGSGRFGDLSFLDALPDSAAVYDQVYHPAETALIQEARRRGLTAENGLSMLLWQAVLALEHFLNRPLDRPAMAEAAAAALVGP